jgi:hypothetical protein
MWISECYDAYRNIPEIRNRTATTGLWNDKTKDEFTKERHSLLQTNAVLFICSKVL